MCFCVYLCSGGCINNCEIYGEGLADKIIFKSMVTSAAVHSKAVNLLLFTHCSLLFPWSVGVLCYALVLLCSTLCHF